MNIELDDLRDASIRLRIISERTESTVDALVLAETAAYLDSIVEAIEAYVKRDHR